MILIEIIIINIIDNKDAVSVVILYVSLSLFVLSQGACHIAYHD